MKFLYLSILMFTWPVFDSVAQDRSSTLGVSVNAHLDGTAWTLDDYDVETESGGGLGIAVGYGLNNLVTFIAQLDYANITPDQGDNYTLRHVDVGAQFVFGSPTNPLRPYLHAALGGRSATIRYGVIEMEVNGYSLIAGGGLKYFVSPVLAFDTSLALGVGQMSRVKVAGLSSSVDYDATSLRLNAGVSWFMNRKR